jgi:hypothetical protein
VLSRTPGRFLRHRPPLPEFGPPPPSYTGQLVDRCRTTKLKLWVFTRIKLSIQGKEYYARIISTELSASVSNR